MDEPKFVILHVSYQTLPTGYGDIVSKLRFTGLDNVASRIDISIQAYAEKFPELQVPLKVVLGHFASDKGQLYYEPEGGRSILDQLILGLTSREIAGIIISPRQYQAFREFLLDFELIAEDDIQVCLDPYILGPGVRDNIREK